MDIVHNRPSWYSTLADVAGGAAAIFGVGHGLWIWSALPSTARVPIHFDWWGMPTRTGPVWSWSLFPALTVGGPLVMRLSRMEILGKLPPPEKEAKRHAAETTLSDFQLLMAVTMAAIQYFAGEVATGRASHVPVVVVRSIVAAWLAWTGVTLYGTYSHRNE